MCEATQRNHANQKVGRDRKGRATRQGLMSTKEEDEIVIHFPSPTWAVACRRYNIEHYNHLDYNHAPSLLHIAQHDVARRVRGQLLQVSARARRGHQASAGVGTIGINLRLPTWNAACVAMLPAACSSNQLKSRPALIVKYSTKLWQTIGSGAGDQGEGSSDRRDRAKLATTRVSRNASTRWCAALPRAQCSQLFL